MTRCSRTVFLALRGVLHTIIVNKVLKLTPIAGAAAPSLAAGVKFLHFPHHVYMYEYISRINRRHALFLIKCFTHIYIFIEKNFMKSPETVYL